MLSVPQSTKLQFDLSGSQHLICVENEAIEAVCLRLQELKSIPDNLQILQAGETVINRKDLKIEQFYSVESLKNKLIEICARAHMGTRFYAVGSERFVWGLKSCVRSLGMSEEEISLEVVGSKARNIYCSNCQIINPQVRTNIFTCSNCGINLEVLEHYSRLKNAYLGIWVDAESLGELPEVEAIPFG